MLVKEEQNVPPSSASNQTPGPSFKMGELGWPPGRYSVVILGTCWQFTLLTKKTANHLNNQLMFRIFLRTFKVRVPGSSHGQLTRNQ